MPHDPASPPAPASGPGACPACGAESTGNFCSRCGVSLGPRRCSHCSAEISSQARFCHRCGRSVDGGRGRSGAHGPEGARHSEWTAWAVAGALALLLVGVIVWRVARSTAAPVIPDMANPGAAQGPFAGGAPAGRAPDISSMSPRERFDRLFNRVMLAAQRGDSATVVTFIPMALGAYGQLDTVDVDARYHAALLMLQMDNVQPALALADTIETAQPGHLFGYLVRGAAADRAQNDTMRRQAYRDFLTHYDAEQRAGRPEYREHQAAIDEFRKQAETAVNGKR
ncbi:MAG TPA: zinc ribbon domain-containing protein [Gemmatimonadales bacterium]